MNGQQLLKARISRKWEQIETAARLKVSQAYLSLMEAGKRPVTEWVARRAVQIFNLPPTALPVKEPVETPQVKTENFLAGQLGGLGYPKFSHLKNTKKVNPAVVLITALRTGDLESRVVEALPWLIYNFPDMDWPQVIKTAKLNDSQKRLGFLLSLAYAAARKTKDENKMNLFKQLLSILEKSRLVRDDSFRRESLTEPEKNWLKKNRPKDARHWRVLSNLTAEHHID
jgi:transcriptional regulator with XRE-family HTH domain